MAEHVAVIGVGMTAFGVHSTRSVPDLAGEAIAEALADAGLGPGDLQAAFYGNTVQGALEGQFMVGGQIALRHSGIERIPVFNVENACATGASAFALAVNHVRAGAASVALAVGVEKMNTPDRQKTMSVFDGAYDVADPEGMRQVLADLGGEIDASDGQARSVFMDIYAAMARAHMSKYGTTQSQLAAVSAKNHVHSVSNPKAHFRKPMSVDEVLGARTVNYPLTVPMCSPITDGAAAAIVCDPNTLARLGRSRAVSVLASVVGTGTTRPLLDYDQHIIRLLAQRTYEAAGVGPEDVQLAEVHDATAFAEILLTEMLGFFEPGTAGKAAAAGITSVGGLIPVNTSGGLESKGHPLAATGLGQIYELVTQLRGEAGARQVPDLRIALAENSGGFYRGEEAVGAITLLST